MDRWMHRQPRGLWAQKLNKYRVKITHPTQQGHKLSQHPLLLYIYQRTLEQLFCASHHLEQQLVQ